MSIWAGVFPLVIAGVIGSYSTLHYDKTNTGLIIIAISIAFFICVLDVRHAGIGMGIMALVFQTVMAALFAFLCFVFLLRLTLNLVTNQRRRRIIAISGCAGAIRQFFGFFIP